MDTPNKEKTAKKGREHYSHDKADARRDKRRQEAEARQRTYDGLSIKARIQLVKSRPGESRKEIARLTALLAKEPPVLTNPSKPKKEKKQKKS